jgi:hypothetical protein
MPFFVAWSRFCKGAHVDTADAITASWSVSPVRAPSGMYADRVTPAVEGNRGLVLLDSAVG